MVGFIFPAFFAVVGIAALIYPQRAGFIFCRMGKTIWKISTFGLTDMHWFYPENNLPRIGRGIGIVLLIVGLPITAISVMAAFPPNSFAAMSQAEAYLHAQYGDANGETSLSCDPTDKSENLVIKYEYSGKTGELHAVWDGKKYIFTQEGVKAQ